MEGMRADEDRRITDAFLAERSRLRAFILRHAPDRFEVEDILQDVFYVFLAHAVEGRSFKELAAATGASINTLLSRKHYAVLHLRGRLRTIYDALEKGGRP